MTITQEISYYQPNESGLVKVNADELRQYIPVFVHDVINGYECKHKMIIVKKCEDPTLIDFIVRAYLHPEAQNDYLIMSEKDKNARVYSFLWQRLTEKYGTEWKIIVGTNVHSPNGIPVHINIDDTSILLFREYSFSF